MPTPKPIHRTYCKTCKNFTVHNSEHICQTCETEFTPYNTKDISISIVEEQRERYTKQKCEGILGIYGAFMQGNGIQAILDSDKPKIIECDAGQLEIDNSKKELLEKARIKGQEILDDYNTNYKHLNRNDKCTCGSGKKFKQCHLIEFKKYLNL